MAQYIGDWKFCMNHWICLILSSSTFCSLKGKLAEIHTQKSQAEKLLSGLMRPGCPDFTPGSPSLINKSMFCLFELWICLTFCLWYLRSLQTPSTLNRRRWMLREGVWSLCGSSVTDYLFLSSLGSASCRQRPHSSSIWLPAGFWLWGQRLHCRLC